MNEKREADFESRAVRQRSVIRPCWEIPTRESFPVDPGPGRSIFVVCIVRRISKTTRLKTIL